MLRLEVHEPNVCFNVQIVNNSSSCFSPRISDQSSSLHSNLLHTDNKLKQLNSMEILIYFIFNTIKFDRSPWLARRKVDWSTPKSGWTLSVDQLLKCFSQNSNLSWCSRHNLLWTSCATLLNNRYIILGSGLVQCGNLHDTIWLDWFIDWLTVS